MCGGEGFCSMHEGNMVVVCDALHGLGVAGLKICVRRSNDTCFSLAFPVCYFCVCNTCFL